MKKSLNKTALINLATGAAFLGSGGGGNPNYELDMIEYLDSKYGAADLITIDQLDDDDTILPIAYVGAPLVGLEKIPSGKEFTNILEAFKKHNGKYPDAIIPAEIGGANALTPFLIAGQLNIPILDADLLGRAYPRLEMASANLYGISPAPTFIADSIGNHFTMHCTSAAKTEEVARAITVCSGSSVAVGIYQLTAKEAKTSLVLGSISDAINIGAAINSGEDLSKMDIKIVSTGIITNIDYKISDGFLVGSVEIQDESGIKYKIKYQNEFLLLESEGTIICQTPDIISILDQDSMLAITSESLIYGSRVAIATRKGPEIWYSKEGLALVGPQVFKL
jgi:DUF917 family protein